jgi:hypothetical protein
MPRRAERDRVASALPFGSGQEPVILVAAGTTSVVKTGH